MVQRVVFTSDDGTFQVVRFKPEDEDELLTLAGNLMGVHAGEPLHAHGEWKMHRQHGPTFDVASYIPVTPRNAEMLEAYLGSGLVKGVGPSFAKRIVKRFGEDTIDILDHAPERLREVRGLGRTRAEAVTKAWTEHRQTHEVMIALAQYGLTPALARRLMRHYGSEAAAVLKHNPYRAGIEVSGIGFATADRIAQSADIELDSPQRIAAAFVHLLTTATDEGHTFLPRETLLSQATELLNLPAETIEGVYEKEEASARIVRAETLPDGTVAVFIPAMHRSESGTARCVTNLLRESKPLLRGDITARLDAFEKRYRFTLAPLQREAIQTTVRGGVTVITGGPGTGKTTLVRALLHVLADEDLHVALCSPTGRAAQRLAETTRRNASTIHRLLRYNAQKHQFTHGPGNPVKADLLIVDEASMLDIPLGYHLLQAVRPGATIVFVGDVDQLPSVGAGNLLRDLIRSSQVPTVRLTAVFRQASQSAIVVNAHRINEGYLPETNDGDAKTDFFFIEREDPEAIREAALEMIVKRIPKRFDLNPVDDVQLLAPMRRGDLGTNALNRLLQERLNAGGSALQFTGGTLRIGDKVIQNSNNYDLEVFNGDVGKITGISNENRTLRVLFNKRFVEYRWDEADQLSLAYAVTIHKSQGSEYPAVVVLLHTQHFVMLRRNLLYTAITRGKRLVVVVGSKRALGMAVRNVTAGERFSALHQWLARPPASGSLVD